MRKFLLFLLVPLVFWPLFASAQAPTSTAYLGTATAASPRTDQDTYWICQDHASNCTAGGVLLVRGANSQLVSYMLQKFNAVAPLNYSFGGGASPIGQFTLTGPADLTTFTAGNVPMGSASNPFAPSEINDVGLVGVTVGNPTGGQKGAATINATGMFVNGVAVATINSGGVTWPPSGNIVISNGTSAPAGLAPVNNQVAVGAAGVWTTLATANSAVYCTNATGVPSLCTTLPTGLTIPGFLVAANNLSDLANVISARSNLGLGPLAISTSLSAALDTIGATQGGILYRGASLWSYLAPGTSGFFLETLGSGQNPVWAAASGGGGAAQTVYVGTISNGGSGNAYTLTLSGGIAQTLPAAYFDGMTVVAHLISPGATANTGASTLAAGSLAAASIFRQSDASTNNAFVGGELIPSNQDYYFTYNAALSAWVNTVYPAGAITITSANVAITNSMWESGRLIEGITSGISFTLPVSTSLGVQGALQLSCANFACAVIPNSADTIQGTGATNTPAFFEGFAIIKTDGAGNIYMNYPGRQDVDWSWLSGVNFHAAPVPLRITGASRTTTVTGISCTVEAPTGTSGDVIDIYDCGAGVIPTGANCTKINTSSCNGNNTGGAVQSMFAPTTLATLYSVPGSDVLWLFSSQWTGTAGGPGSLAMRLLR